jgi:hypothetical protein
VRGDYPYVDSAKRCYRWQTIITPPARSTNQDPFAQKGDATSSVRLISPGITSKYKLRFTGWKFGVTTCAAVATMVCLINIVLTLWAIRNHGHENGLSYLYTGSCTEVASISLWIHLGINVMSTVLLSASNCR